MPLHAPHLPARHGPPPHRARDGLTLAELVVALTLLTVGLLALASTSAFLTHELAASRRAEHAAILAGSRLEILRPGGCRASRGAETIDGLATTWSVTPAGSVAAASVAVAWRERRGPVVHRYTTAFAC